MIWREMINKGSFIA